MSDTADQTNFSLRIAIPPDRVSTAPAPGNDLVGRGQPGSFFSRRAAAGIFTRRLVQHGIPVKQTDQYSEKVEQIVKAKEEDIMKI